MLQHDRVKLLFGPYRTPRCKMGGSLRCVMRERVKVAGLTDARIPWPYVPQPGGNGHRSLILCGDLVKAVRRESETAVAYWWGVSAQTVWKWRKALGVEKNTEGTIDLNRRWSPETVLNEEATRKRMESMKSPERAAKIAAARRGKPRPTHVIEALRKANTGKKASEEARRRMSEAHKRRGTIPPAMAGPLWTPEEDALLGTMPDKDVAERIGRTPTAVPAHRSDLGIPNFFKRKPPRKPPRWTPEKDVLLGTMPDSNPGTQAPLFADVGFLPAQKAQDSSVRWPVTNGSWSICCEESCC